MLLNLFLMSIVIAVDQTILFNLMMRNLTSIKLIDHQFIQMETQKLLSDNNLRLASVSNYALEIQNVLLSITI